ncbi:homeotic protein proboscipedia-like [Scylla paramamosain]|uniref:homeotic protein proboscipedia-like n=1 Tax=Scylla paramamosain TaxID=85552 RepID=UPI0030834746
MVTHMADSWSHVMYAAEDNFLNFMEDVTDHGHHDQGHGHHHDHHHDQGHHHGHSSFHSRIEYNPDVSNDEYAFHNDYYNKHGQDEYQEHVRQDQAFHDDSSAPSVHRPYRTETAAHTGGITRLTNMFGFHNNIPDEEKIKYLNVVLGGNYQQTTDQPPAQDGGVEGLFSSYDTFHSRPPTGHPPHPHSQPPASWHQELHRQSPFYPTRGPSFVRFQHESQPPRDGHPHPRFRPSPLMQESLREDWVAAMDPESTLNETDAKGTNITSEIKDDEDETTVATTTIEISTASP